MKKKVLSITTIAIPTLFGVYATMVYGKENDDMTTGDLFTFLVILSFALILGAIVYLLLSIHENQKKREFEILRLEIHTRVDHWLSNRRINIINKTQGKQPPEGQTEEDFIASKLKQNYSILSDDTRGKILKAFFTKEIGYWDYHWPNFKF